MIEEVLQYGALLLTKLLGHFCIFLIKEITTLKQMPLKCVYSRPRCLGTRMDTGGEPGLRRQSSSRKKVKVMTQTSTNM